MQIVTTSMMITMIAIIVMIVKVKIVKNMEAVVGALSIT